MKNRIAIISLLWCVIFLFSCNKEDVDKYPMCPYSFLVNNVIDSSGLGVQIYVPNSFTPNYDGINDLFYPIGSNIDKISIVVFGGLESDKNGTEVYIYGNNGKYNKWYGDNLKGKTCPEGSYPYRIKYISTNGDVNIVRGIVRLYRN